MAFADFGELSTEVLPVTCKRQQPNLTTMIGSSGPEKETRAMNQEQKVIRVKVGVLEVAKQLGNVSAACRVMG